MHLLRFGVAGTGDLLRLPAAQLVPEKHLWNVPAEFRTALVARAMLDSLWRDSKLYNGVESESSIALIGLSRTGGPADSRGLLHVWRVCVARPNINKNCCTCSLCACTAF